MHMHERVYVQIMVVYTCNPSTQKDEAWGIVSSKPAWATEPDPVSNVKMLTGRVFLEGIGGTGVGENTPILQPQLILVQTLNTPPLILQHIPSHPASLAASHQDHHPEQVLPGLPG